MKPKMIPPDLPFPRRSRWLPVARFAAITSSAFAALVSDSFDLPDGAVLGGAVVNGVPRWTADGRVVLANGVVTTNANGHAEFKLPVPGDVGERLVVKADLRVGEGAEWAGLFLGAGPGARYNDTDNPLMAILRGNGFVQLLKNGVSHTFYTSSQAVAGFDRAKFHALELRYDRGGGTVDVLVDGKRINSAPVPVGELNQSSVGAAGVRFHGGVAVAAEPAAGDFSCVIDGREFSDSFAAPDGPLDGATLDGAPTWRAAGASLVVRSGAVTTDADGGAELVLPVPARPGGTLILKADLRVGEGADWAGLFFGAGPQSGFTDTDNPLMAILRGNGYVQLLKNGVSTTFFTSGLPIPEFDRAASYTLELRYDREARTADVFVDGARLSAQPLPLSGLNGETVGAIGVRFQRAKAGKPAVDNISYTEAGREALVCYLSWHSPLGKLNGTRQWGSRGYRYQGAAESGGVLNHPFLPLIEDFPTQAPVVGGAEFYRLQREAASFTLAQMGGAGFDGLLFDMLPMPDYEPGEELDEFNSPLAHFKTFLVWLEEAERNGMKVGLMPDIANQSGDYPQRRNPSVAEWTRILAGALDQTPDSPALWRIDGRPVLAHFGTDSFYGSAAPDPSAPKPEGGWRQILANLRDAGKSFHFIADIRPHAQIGVWNDIADSAWVFTPAAPAGALPDMQRVIAANLSIPLMWTVSPGYYRGGVAYTQPDFARIHHTYLAAMRAGARRICVLTWNDFEEDTDIVPSDNKGHALLDVFAYYNQWFKTGTLPVLDQDRVVLAYPRRIPAATVTPSPRYGRLGNDLGLVAGAWPSPAYLPKVFYWAWVREPGSLSVAGVGEVSFPRAGLWYGELGVASPGPVRASFRGRAGDHPEIIATAEEKARSGEGGLEYRYVNLTSQL